MHGGPWRLSLLFVVGLFLAGPPGAPGAADADPLSPDERAWLQAHGPIRYAPDPDYPPFERTDGTGNHSGINFDFLNRMSRNLDIEFEIVDYPNWTAVLEAKRRGEVDLLGSMASNPEREEYLDFIGPYMAVGEVFYITEPDRFQTVDDLVGADAQVAVVQNYAAAAWLAEHHPELDLLPVPDMLTGLERLALGEVDAFFENVPVAGFYIRQQSLDTITIMGKPLYYSEANWGYTKGNDLLGSIITKGLDSISPGEQTAIFEFWTGSDLSVPPAANTTERDLPAWVTLALLVVSGLALAGGSFTMLLRRQVAQKTERIQRQARELAAANETLEERVRQRTHELEDLHDNLGMINHAVEDALDAGQQSFSRFRTTLENQYHGILNESTRLQLQAADRDMTRLGRLIANIRALELATGGPVQRSSVRVDHVVAPIVRALTAEHGTPRTVHVSEDLTVHTDKRLLTAILEHLLASAWRSTRDTPEATIEITQGPEQENGIQVADNGPPRPLPENDLTQWRGESHAELGLVVAARAVHFLGGDLHFEATAEGNRVAFTLGLHDDTPTPTTPYAEATTAS